MSDDPQGSDQALDDLVRWLVFELSPTATTVELLQGFADRLCKVGLDLLRMVVQAQPLSPQASTLLHVWRPAEREMEMPPLVRVVDQEQHALEATRLQVLSLAHGAFETTAFRASPFHEVMTSSGPEVRRRIGGDQSELDFPILEDLRAQGATDYIALPLTFYGSAPSAISFATRKAAGFSERDLALLRKACQPLVMALSPRLQAHTTRTLLGAYLGTKTAERVLAGSVQRAARRRGGDRSGDLVLRFTRFYAYVGRYCLVRADRVAQRLFRRRRARHRRFRRRDSEVHR